MAAVEVRPGVPSRETVNHIRYKLPDGNAVLLTLQETFIADFLSEETTICRLDWARRAYPDPKLIVTSVATDSIGTYRRYINKKFADANWEIEEILPANYSKHYGKKDATYRLNYKGRQTPDDTVTVVREPSNPDSARILYVGEPPNSPSVETTFIHKPFELASGEQIRYLTKTGWQMMDELAPTLEAEDIVLPKEKLIYAINAQRTTPIEDTEFSRELALFTQTTQQFGLTLINDTETDRQGYVTASNFRLRRGVEPNGHEEGGFVYEPFMKSKPDNEISAALAGFAEMIADQTGGSKTKKPQKPLRLHYALVLGETTAEKRNIIQNVPYIEPRELARLRRMLNRDALERLANLLPRNFDRAEDAPVYPPGTLASTADAIIRMATYVAAFTQGQIRSYDLQRPVTCIRLKEDIQTCLNGYLVANPDRELADIFEAVVTYVYKKEVVDRLYPNNLLLDLDFSSIQEEEQQAFAVQFTKSVGNVYRYALYKVGRQDLAEDITQDVFAKAWGGKERYMPGKPYEHFLLRITRNTIIDHHREHQTKVAAKSLSLDEVTTELPMGHSENPVSEEVERQAEIFLVRQAVERLEGEDRLLIRLRYWHNEEWQEIAEFMGISNIAARQRHIRILAHLRKMMETQLALSLIAPERVIYHYDPNAAASINGTK